MNFEKSNEEPKNIFVPSDIEAMFDRLLSENPDIYLSKEDQALCIDYAALGVRKACKVLIQKYYNSTMRYVEAWAQRHELTTSHCNLEDLKASVAANMVSDMENAAKGYDKSFSTQFVTYYRKCKVDAYIQSEILNQLKALGETEHYARLINNLTKFEENFYNTNNRPPSDEECAANIPRLSINRINLVRQMRDWRNIIPYEMINALNGNHTDEDFESYGQYLNNKALITDSAAKEHDIKQIKALINGIFEDFLSSLSEEDSNLFVEYTENNEEPIEKKRMKISQLAKKNNLTVNEYKRIINDIETLFKSSKNYAILQAILKEYIANGYEF